jgi:hypothetical protein
VGTVLRKSDSDLQFLLRGRRRHIYGDTKGVNVQGVMATAPMDNTERARMVAELLGKAKERQDLVK